MAQVTIYLDEETEKKMKNASQATGLSTSKWITSAIKDKLNNDWPDSIKNLAGSWADDDSLDDVLMVAEDTCKFGEDAPRESF